MRSVVAASMHACFEAHSLASWIFGVHVLLEQEVDTRIGGVFRDLAHDNSLTPRCR
jgi:hypothetical protein